MFTRLSCLLMHMALGSTDTLFRRVLNKLFKATMGDPRADMRNFRSLTSAELASKLTELFQEDKLSELGVRELLEETLRTELDDLFKEITSNLEDILTVRTGAEGNRSKVVKDCFKVIANTDRVHGDKDVTSDSEQLEQRCVINVIV